MLLPTIGQVISKATHLSCVFVRALRDGREPIDAARTADLGYIPSAMSTEQKAVRWFITYDEAHHLYFDEFVPALKLPVTSEEALKDTEGAVPRMGPLVSKAQCDKVWKYIDEAIVAGLKRGRAGSRSARAELTRGRGAAGGRRAAPATASSGRPGGATSFGSGRRRRTASTGTKARGQPREATTFGCPSSNARRDFAHFPFM